MTNTLDAPAEPAQNTSREALTADENDLTHTSGTAGDSDAAESHGSANAEAAKYRKRLRDVEAERDSLAGKVEALQRAEILRTASNLSEPNDLFALGGVALLDLIDGAGNVDTEKVNQVVAEILEARPGLHKDSRRPTPQRYPNFGQSARLHAGGGGSTISWSDALKGGR